MSRQINTKPFYDSIIPACWEVIEMKNICTKFLNGGTPSTQVSNYWNGSIPWITGADIVEQKVVYRRLISETAVKESSTNIIPKGNLLLVTRTGVGKVAIAPFDVAISQDLTGIILDEKIVCPQFIFYYFDGNEKALQQLNQGTSINGITRDVLQKLKIPLPPLPEQKAIAYILGLMDTAINKNNLLIEKKEQRKKWLMQMLLTGKKRLKGFEKTKWKIQSLENFIKPVSREIEKPDKPYLGIGIRSHGRGTFLKQDELPEKNTMETFYVVRKDDLIVNITFAWEQAIAIVKPEDDGALASHRFPTFTFIEKKGCVDFFRFFILQRRMKHMLQLISPGGAGRNRVMSKSDFIKLEFYIPEFGEQTAIAQILQLADKEIQLLKSKTEKLREEKKGLMQVLLTGKKRLNQDLQD